MAGDNEPSVHHGRDREPNHTMPGSDERPTKRLKLSVRKPEPEEHHGENNITRPKRKTARPARFSEVALIVNPPKPDRKPIERSTESPAAATPTSVDSTEPSAYGMDFFMNYIDDLPSEPSSASDMHDSIAVKQPSPPTASTTKDEPTTIKVKAKPKTETEPIVEGQLPLVFDKPPMVDSPEGMIRKLTNAVHALGNLNIPSPPRQLVPASSPTSPKFAAGIDALLQAAGSESPLSQVSSPIEESSTEGVPDDDMRLLIHHAVQLLRRSMVSKVQMQSSSTRGPGRQKRDSGIGAMIDAERTAMSALEEVSQSNAININCIVSSHRANLMWHLYGSLLYLLAPPSPPVAPSTSIQPPISKAAPSHPHHTQPRTHKQAARPQAARPETTQQQASPSHRPSTPVQYSPDTMNAARKLSRAHERNGEHGLPPPHQFLLRDEPVVAPTKVKKHEKRRSSLIEQARVYNPTFVPLPRSGQSMKFSFQPPAPSKLGVDKLPFSANAQRARSLEILVISSSADELTSQAG